MATQNGRSWSSGDIVTAANLSSIERGVSTLTEEYTPTTWANGNTVTAAGLNNIEQGIANAGGGSSDFSTASVTVVNGGNSRSLVGANALDDGEDTGSVGSIGIGQDETKVVHVILYKGVAWVSRGDATIVSVSGSAEKLGSSMVMVTGDCTITISDLSK